MPYVPPSVRRAAEAAGLGVEEYLAQQKAAAAPRELGEVRRHSPRRTRSSSNRRRRTVVAKGRRGLSVRLQGRRVRINGGVGVNELHPRHVEPFEEGDNYRSANYRVAGGRPLASQDDIEAVHQRQRRKSLMNVMDRRIARGEVAAEIDAALASLSARGSLNAANSLAIAALRDRLMDSNA